MGRYEHREVFPTIAQVIKEKYRQSTGFVSHDEIVAGLRDHADLQNIFERLDFVPDPHPREWEASNMVAWWSKRFTEATNPNRHDFDRQRQELGGNWAYQPI